MKTISKENISTLLSYDKDSGIFTWKERLGNTKSDNIFNSLFARTVAGSKLTSKRSKTEYIAIKIHGKSYKAHRLAFLIMEGEMPDQVDHLDRNGLNNKWSNLRRSNNKDNSKNKPIQKSNKTGVVGVNWHKAAGKWHARAVNKEGKRIDLGRYDDFEEAVKVRKMYEVEYGYYQHREEVDV